MRSNPNALRLNITLSWRSEPSNSYKYAQQISSEIQYDNWAAVRFRRFQQRTNNGLIYSHTKFKYFANKHIKLMLIHYCYNLTGSFITCLVWYFFKF